MRTALLIIALTTSAQAADVRDFWPGSDPAHQWRLMTHSARRPAMTVRNEPVDGGFILWFSGKPGQPADETDGEQYRVCQDGNRDWLYLDQYIRLSAHGARKPHPVATSRALVTAGGKTEDLIEDGSYARCGGHGQPYLIWRGGPSAYRIQVWGTLTEAARFKWFWDASVSGPEVITDDCLSPPRQFQAVRVQEAWWSTFDVPGGKWGMGSGDVADGSPTGSAVSYGRTVWHGNREPYLMIGNPAGRVGSCVGD